MQLLTKKPPWQRGAWTRGSESEQVTPPDVDDAVVALADPSSQAVFTVSTKELEVGCASWHGLSLSDYWRWLSG